MGERCRERKSEALATANRERERAKRASAGDGGCASHLPPPAAYSFFGSLGSGRARAASRVPRPAPLPWQWGVSRCGCKRARAGRGTLRHLPGGRARKRDKEGKARPLPVREVYASPYLIRALSHFSSPALPAGRSRPRPRPRPRWRGARGETWPPVLLPRAKRGSACGRRLDLRSSLHLPRRVGSCWARYWSTRGAVGPP